MEAAQSRLAACGFDLRKRIKGTQEMTRHGGRTNANRAHHSHNPYNHLGSTNLGYLVEWP